MGDGYYRGGGGGNAIAILLAFVLGGMIGAVLGILFAPRAGEESRAMIKDQMDDLVEKGKGVYDDTTVKVNEAMEQGKTQYSEKADEIKTQDRRGSRASAQPGRRALRRRPGPGRQGRGRSEAGRRTRGRRRQVRR